MTAVCSTILGMHSVSIKMCKAAKDMLVASSGERQASQTASAKKNLNVRKEWLLALCTVSKEEGCV